MYDPALEERKRNAALWVVGELSGMIPAHGFNWDTVTDHVADADKDFGQALAAWDGSDQKGRAVIAAGNKLISTWREAINGVCSKDSECVSV